MWSFENGRGFTQVKEKGRERKRKIRQHDLGHRGGNQREEIEDP